MAPQVGLEPTTLRLTAGEYASRLLILKGFATDGRHPNRYSLGVLLGVLLGTLLRFPFPASGFPLPVAFGSGHFGFCVARGSAGLFQSGTGSLSARRNRTCPPMLSSKSVCMKSSSGRRRRSF